MFEWSPVSTNVIFQSAMSRLCRRMLLAFPESWKSFESHSSYSMKYFLIRSPR